MDLSLLVADDEKIICNGITNYIKHNTKRFSKIYIAENGQEAIDIINQYNPDIMLLDISMPIKNGIDVMKEASKTNILPMTIILSGYEEFEFAQQALRYGAKDYLLKPARAADILNEVNKLADRIINGKKAIVPNIKSNCNHLVYLAQEYIDENYQKKLTLTQVADKLGITGGYLSTLFSQNLNCGFVEYLNKIRIEHACYYLTQNYYKIYEIAYKTGFKDEKYFTKTFRKYKGVTPKKFRDITDLEVY